jgi:ferredoxin
MNMIRKIIKIDEEKCNGCGACATACHEGAIEMIANKAKLTREDYCDGLGDCLPVCPTDAITFEEREAPAYDEAAVLAAKQKTASYGLQWPLQIKLVPVQASYFDGADVLVAADCTAFAYKDFHTAFRNNQVVLVACSKLDACDYAEKLTNIFANNDIRTITVARMEVPCCGGIENAVHRAVQMSGKKVPVKVAVISTDGRRLN